jgi:Protein of unknown function (DUF3617)
MNIHLATNKILAALAACLALASKPVFAQSLPAAGMWELTVAMKGGPRAGGTQKTSTCLSAAQLGNPEQAMFDGVGASGANKDAPQIKCQLANVQRDGANTRWSSTCEGPRGPMNGAGSGTLGPDTAQLVQTFDVSTPMGKMKLEQNLSARRTGECQ